MGLFTQNGLLSTTLLTSNGLFRDGLIPAAPMAVLAASIQNRYPSAIANQAGCETIAFRSPNVIANKCNYIQAVLTGRFIAGPSITNVGNDYTISSMSIETPGGLSVPVTFSGSRSVTIANGNNDIKSDKLYAANLGAEIAAGGVYWLKGIITLPVANNSVPTTPYYQDVSTTECQFSFFATAATTPSTTDAIGIYTFTGTAPTEKSDTFMPFIVGEQSSSNRVPVVFGDSITQDSTDTANSSYYGRGYWQRAMYNGGVSSLASMNFSRGGIQSSIFPNGDAGWKDYLKYANIALIALGTNDFGTLGTDISLATYQSRINAFVTAIEAGGINKICFNEIGPRVLSTLDLYATESGQTVAPDWDAGGIVDTANTWLSSLVGTGSIKAFFQFPANKGTVSSYKWRTNGTGNYMTLDGLHPRDVGHANRAAVIAPVIRVL